MTRANRGLGGESYTFVSRRARGRESGASVVEFALVVPFLLMLVFGVIEFGTVMAQKATVASAAREGARYGSVNLYASAVGTPRYCSHVVAKAREQARTIGMEPADLAVTVKRGTTEATAATMCAASANAAPTGARVSLPPCQGATSTDILYVETSFGAQLNVPLVTAQSLPLKNTGASRCEYN